MRPIELNGIINRTQMQERDDSRPVVEQQTMGHMEDKKVMVKSSQINKNEDTMMNTGYDARREGKGFRKGKCIMPVKNISRTKEKRLPVMVK